MSDEVAIALERVRAELAEAEASLETRLARERAELADLKAQTAACEARRERDTVALERLAARHLAAKAAQEKIAESRARLREELTASVASVAALTLLMATLLPVQSPNFLYTLFAKGVAAVVGWFAGGWSRRARSPRGLADEPRSPGGTG